MDNDKNDIVFRLMTKEDVAGVVMIENASFGTPWTEKAFFDEIENDLAHYLIVLQADKIVAYVGAWIILDEAHITNVAVLPKCRRQSIGEKLMIEMIDFVKKRGVSSMTLEVRPSNTAALQLYEKLHFVQAGIRKNYYESPCEDAVIMWLRDMR